MNSTWVNPKSPRLGPTPGRFLLLASDSFFATMSKSKSELTKPIRSTEPKRLMDDATVSVIFKLRLLIARAAQPDALQWWDDRSFVPEGMYVVERLFPRRPDLAAAQIALASARGRHIAALQTEKYALHLFDLGDEIEWELEQTRIRSEWLPSDIPHSMDEFTLMLGRLVPDGAGEQSGMRGANDTLEIELLPDRDKALPLVLAQASALALAYTTAEFGRPVFPFLRRAH